MSGGLDDLVTGAAAALMGANSANHVAISERILHDLADHFSVDFVALRHTDHTIRATILIASWPPRWDVPDPDPLGVVYFAEADSVFALIEKLHGAIRSASRSEQLRLSAQYRGGHRRTSNLARGCAVAVR